MNTDNINDAAGRIADRVLAWWKSQQLIPAFEVVRASVKGVALEELQGLCDGVQLIATRGRDTIERAVPDSENDLRGLLSETLQLLQEAALGDSGDPEQDAYERDLYDRVLAATGGHMLRPRLPRVGDYVAFGSHHKHAGKVMSVDASGITVSVPERHNGKCFFVTDPEGVLLLHRAASPAKDKTAENGGN